MESKELYNLFADGMKHSSATEGLDVAQTKDYDEMDLDCIDVAEVLPTGR